MSEQPLQESERQCSLHAEGRDCIIHGPCGPPIPVVPCDDAAIERAIDALGGAQGLLLPGKSRREVVERVFRAAGETP